MGKRAAASRVTAPASPAAPLALSGPVASTAAQILGPPPEAEPTKSCVNQLHCGGENPQDDASAAPGGQAETSLAVSGDGRAVVVGFNDTQGFSSNPVSLSGVRVSANGGKTFGPGTRLPVTPTHAIGATLYPQVFGDPDVKWLGGCNFAYASILVTVKEYLLGLPTAVQTLSVHRSRDCGQSWEGPFEVTGATNPNGFIFSNGAAVDAADKEFMDYDARTGRLLISWTNFTHPSLAPSGVQMLSTYADDVLGPAAPTFSPAALVSATAFDGQASIPRFGPGTDAYVAFRRFDGLGNMTAVAHSSDDGATWGTPVETSPVFFTMDQVPGNDRINTSPSLAVGKRGANRGKVFVVYANNDSGDGADIAFQVSSDQGATWSPTVFVNSRPGQDRAQWFPWITLDDDSGRIFVFYYDQGVATSGDLTQVTYTWSDDGGRHWAPPMALSDRPFHAGWGNDTGQPNLGDYNQAVVQNGKLYASFALVSRPPLGFADGQPTGSFTVPDLEVKVLPNATQRFEAAPLELARVEVRESGRNGYLDPRELFTVAATLRNSSTNPLARTSLRNLEGKLRTSTPGVDVFVDESRWARLGPGEASGGAWPFVLFTRPGFVHGTPIELELTVSSERHDRTTLRATVFTGTPQPTTLLSEGFDGAASLPPGWVAAHGAGVNVVPWRVAEATPALPGFCGATSNGVFHPNANDGVGGTGTPSRWERLISPTLTAPADAEYVTVEFDLCHDTEDDPSFSVLAYDGVFLRVTDLTPGRLLRSALAEAFADEFTTGDRFH